LASPAKQQLKQAQSKIIATSVGTAADYVKAAAVDAAIKSGSASAKASATSFAAGSFLGSIIEGIGGLSIGLISLFKKQKRQKKAIKLAEKQQQSQDYVDHVLTQIEEVGSQLLQQGFNPLTPDFEKTLYSALYEKVGYRGNCNAIIWAPGSQPGPNRPVYFKVTGNGRLLTPVTLKESPPYLQEYWYARCKGLKDLWITQYQDLLIQEGRLQELEELQATLKRGKLLVTGSFSLIFLIIGVIFIMNVSRMSK